MIYLIVSFFHASILLINFSLSNLFFPDQNYKESIFLTKKIDSLFKQGQFDSVPFYSSDLYQIGVISQDTNLIVQSVYAHSNSFFLLNRDYVLTDYLIQDNKKYLSGVRDSLLLISLIRLEGNVKTEMGNYEDAHQVYRRGMDLCESFMDQRICNFIWMDDLFLNKIMGKYEESSDSLVDVFCEKYMSLDNIQDEIYLGANFSSLVADSNPQFALETINSTIRLQQHIGELPYTMIALKGRIFKNLGMLDSALLYYDKSIEITCINNNERGHIASNLSKLELLVKQGDCVRAMNLAKEILEIQNFYQYDEDVILDFFTESEICTLSFSDINYIKTLNQKNLYNTNESLKVKLKLLNEQTNKSKLESSIKISRMKFDQSKFRYKLLISGLFLFVSLTIIMFYVYTKNERNSREKLIAQKHIIKNYNFKFSSKRERKLYEDLEFFMKKSKIFLSDNPNREKVLDHLKIEYEEFKRFLIFNGIADSFIDLINKYKVVYSAELISDKANNNLTIEALAEKAGFNTRQSFYNSFEKHMGMSPSQFKKNIQKGTNLPE